MPWLVMDTVKTNGFSSSFGSMYLNTNCRLSSDEREREREKEKLNYLNIKIS